MVEAQSGRSAASSGRILVLNPDLVHRFMEEFLLVDRDMLGEPWSPAHFLAERPEKWRWSHLALDPEGRVEAFVIASLKGDVIHCHRVAVRSDRRSRGLGAVILRAVGEAAEAGGVNRIGCKVARENDRAVRWYRRLGFRVISGEPANLLLEAPVAELLRNTADRAALERNPPA